MSRTLERDDYDGSVADFLRAALARLLPIFSVKIDVATRPDCA